VRRKQRIYRHMAATGQPPAGSHDSQGRMTRDTQMLNSGPSLETAIIRSELTDRRRRNSRQIGTVRKYLEHGHQTAQDVRAVAYLLG
jgi:hypothetical protein